MSSSIKNILELPDEILERIMSMVPNKPCHISFKPDEVCKRFYHVFRNRPRQLTITNTINGSLWSKFKVCENEEVFQNIIQSQKKIRVLKIYHANISLSSDDVSFHRLTKIFETHGKNITKLDLHYSEFTGGFFFSLLNSMPNLEVVNIFESRFADFDIPEGFQLKLHKLRELYIRSREECLYEVFNRLPDNVLHTLHIVSLFNANDDKKFFENQRNIKDFKDHNVESNFLNIDAFKLRNLELTSLGFVGKLSGQDQLVSLKVKEMDQEHFDYICNNLKFLEEFSMFISCYRFNLDMSQLNKLKKLKKFSVNSNKNFSSNLTTLKSESVEQLILKYFTREILINIAQNCPNLKYLEVNYSDMYTNVSEILQHLPNLEEFGCPAVYIKKLEKLDTKNVRNNSLRILHLDALCLGTAGIINLLSIVKCCKNLEKIKISTAYWEHEREKACNKKFKKITSLFYFVEDLDETGLELAAGIEMEKLFTEHLQINGKKIKYILTRNEIENQNEELMVEPFEENYQPLTKKFKH